MDATMHGKKIASVYWTDTETEQGRYLASDGEITLELSITYHGDHDEIWVVQLKNGKEVARHNPRYIETIAWE